jgi:hypothetical protein
MMKSNNDEFGSTDSNPAPTPNILKQFIEVRLWASALGLLPPALACTNDEDCDLNGIYSRNTCVCDPGWTDSDCGRLDLHTGPQVDGYNLTRGGIIVVQSNPSRPPKQGPLPLDRFEFTHGCGDDY